MRNRTIQCSAALGAAALLLSACGDTDVGGAGGGGGGEEASGGSIAEDFDLSGASVTVGSKEFTESLVLGQITIAALQAAGADVSDQTGLTGTDTVRAALESGEIDMYWEYTGTGWVNILGNPLTDLPEDLLAAVTEADAANDIEWAAPAPLNNTYAIAVPTAFAEENGLETLSDAAEYLGSNPDDATMCAASEFLNRDDGLPGLEAAYGVEFEITELDFNLIYTAVGSDCNFAEVTSTDGRIVANDLTVLADDQEFFVPYNACLTVRSDVLEESPEIADIMRPIGELLTDEKILELNAGVDVDGEQPADVARTFLQDEGFIG